MKKTICMILLLLLLINFLPVTVFANGPAIEPRYWFDFTNLPEGTKLCYGCGKRIPIGGGRRYCEACQPREAVPTVQVAECVICGEKYMTRDHQEGAMCPACAHMKSAGGRCVDCGTLLPERMMGRPSNRCSACQQHRRRELTKHRVIKYRCNA